jgi:AcrR family transcriptional regulator
MNSDNSTKIPGLRERKKAKAMAAIQAAALKLFTSQGYEATTVEQIAEAADVSPSTFFRYFSTKKAVVLHDNLDPLIIDAFRNQPAELSVIQALRKALHSAFTEIPKEALGYELKRGELILKEPGLRAAMIDEFARNIDMFSELIGERLNRQADDVAVRTLAGAIIGALLSVILQKDTLRPERHYFENFDSALEQLENGLAIR